jgi:2,4-dienoyl-CoA reductase [(3E)-enoyl-CoA-producing], peroxisomal
MSAPDQPKDLSRIFRPDLLKGHVALITGGGSGIGLEIVRTLMSLGAHAVIVGRRKTVLEDAKASLEEETGVYEQRAWRGGKYSGMSAMLCSCA